MALGDGMANEVIGVVGAGLMGAEIALVYALAGHEVLLNDKDQSSLDRGYERIRGVVTRGIERRQYSNEHGERALGSIRLSLSTDVFSQADMVIEAVFESFDVKTKVLFRLDEVCKPSCLIATNTSTIPISTLAATLPKARREFFIGTHYFSPVSRMPLVEIIKGFETGESAFQEAMRLTRGAGKTPIHVKDVAGFAVNRVLHVFLIEAVRLVEEGVATPEDIDTACRLGLGHPIGPFELMDAVSSSLCVQAQEIMQEAYGERFRSPPLLKQRVRAGFTGGKGKPGWRTP